ncbi:MAG TPA: AAA family ATPase [Anaeromyxobacteraceae bacterium]|nr:AAA family ATPase [Anaeromyxobacteraceae bacterium]
MTGTDGAGSRGTPGAAPQRPRFVEELETLVRARYPLVYLVSWEEQRVDAHLEELAREHGKAYLTWSATKGLRQQGGSRTPAPEASREPPAALAAIEKLADPSLVVLKDFHPYLSDPGVVRALRELAQSLKSTYTTLILLSPILQIPPEMEKEITVLDVPLPTYRELYDLLREIAEVVVRGKKAVVDLRREDVEQIVKAAQGLTLSEAENAFAKAIASDQKLSRADIALILDEKRQVIRKSGLLEYYPTEEHLQNVGGLENLKTWLSRRANAFGEPARRFGLPEPRGLLLLGVQGCGKSLVAKAIASTWKLPLLRLDMGRIFSGLVGSSEENLRRAIRVAESVAPAVLWTDEIEKGLSGSSSSGSADGGVTARVFGALLTWLQEKTAPVFVVATANRVDLLPPELLRKGRFDEIFFVDLPSEAERRDIFRIHVARRGRRPEAFDLSELARLAEGFSGAEIEQAVISALYDAFAEGRDLAQDHLTRSVRETFPLATTVREEIEELRDWARARTRPASPSPETASAPPAVARPG